MRMHLRPETLDERLLRFLFYSHDGMGLGHTRRNLAIASALVELCPPASVLLASSTDEAHHLGLPPRVEILKLPGLRKTAAGDYLSRRLPVQRDEIRHLRASILEAAVRAFRPTVALVDKHPFGARGEFRAGLEALKEYGGRAVLGLRDILDEPQIVRQEWAEHDLHQLIAAFHDRIFVYGDRAVFNPIAEYGLSASVARRARFCGYVVNRDDDDVRSEPRPPEFNRERRGRPVVLGTAGGGEDGFALLECFISASAGAPWQGVAIAGPMTPPRELNVLRRRAEKCGVRLHTFIPRLPTLFNWIDALVCMGGYNTLAEAASRGMPVVCVPRRAPRREQVIRALAFERLGLVTTLRLEELRAAPLRAKVSDALQLSRPRLLGRAHAMLTFDGARKAAKYLLAMAVANAGGATRAGMARAGTVRARTRAGASAVVV